MVHYIDERGKIHYVDTDYSKVPERYRDQVAGQLAAEEKKAGHSPAALPPGAGGEATTGRTNNVILSSGSGLQIDLFVKPACVECAFLEIFLNSERIPYDRHDVTQDPNAKKMFAELGSPPVPVIKIGSRVISGFQAAEIQSAIKSQLPFRSRGE